MAYYKFVRRDNGKADSLAFVDERMCEFDGSECPKERFSMGHQAIVDLGFALLMSKGGSEVQLKDVEELLDKVPDLSPTEDRFVRWVFDTWVFQGWR